MGGRVFWNFQSQGCGGGGGFKIFTPPVVGYGYCVVPENIPTPTMEGIGNSGWMKGQRSRKFQRGGDLDGQFSSQMSFNSIQI